MRLLREPFLHFSLLGVLIFVAYGLMSDAEDHDEIVVTQGQQNNLISTFQRTWRRPPTPDEFRGLVQDFIREEIAYREASAMQLDRNDIVIRRRLRQKLELLTEDIAALAPPTEAELAAYYDAHKEEFRTDARYTFEQIFFNPERRGANVARDVAGVMSKLRSGAPLDIGATGDALGVPVRMSDARSTEVDAVFGRGFADALADLPLGEWGGPVESGFGLHLVRVTERVDSRVPEQEEIGRQLLNELLGERRTQAVDALYQKLAQDYEIRVEPPDDTAPASLE